MTPRKAHKKIVQWEERAERVLAEYTASCQPPESLAGREQHKDKDESL